MSDEWDEKTYNEHHGKYRKEIEDSIVELEASDGNFQEIKKQIEALRTKLRILDYGRKKPADNPVTKAAKRFI